MEDIRIKKFVSVSYGGGSGVSIGGGWGRSNGWGNVWGAGRGDGDGDGAGDDNGAGNGAGSGAGNGAGNGDGFGGGNGDGAGGGFGVGRDGIGYSGGIKSICGELVHMIDGVPTIIAYVNKTGNIAKGKILNDDLTTTKCFVVKQDDIFAHGKSLRAAMVELEDKLYEDMPVEERIKNFCNEFKADEAYPTQKFYDWHGKLTDSCELGREHFVKNRGIDLNGTMTVAEFISLTENAEGYEIIREVKKRYTGA